MRVYIVRHGKANDGPTPGIPDAAANPDFGRELTSRGVAQARFLASRLRGVERRITTIIASRYPRALQTAHTMQATIGCSITTDSRLEVDHDVSEALAVIQDRADDRAVMLVGHNPQLGELISVLCSGLAPQELMLKTGELVAIDCRPSQLVGSGKIIERLRLCDMADDTFAGNPLDVTTALRK